MKTSFLIAGACAVLASACAAGPQSKTTSTAPSVEFSDAGLANLDNAMQQFVKDGHTYGIHTVLVHGDETVAESQYGLRDVITKKPITDDTIYRIYSMSKPITGVAMMQLYEQGKWSLEDPVTKFIPEFADLKVLSKSADGTWQEVAMNRAPNMREVMSHSAGFAYGLTGSDPANTAFRQNAILRSPDMKTFIDKVSEVPLLFQPGEDWAYSAAVDIQGAIVERISGQTFGEYLDEHIFTPLGMDDTGFYVPAEDYGRFSQVFGYNPENGQLVPVPTDSVKFKKDTIAFEGGGGGLTSTMSDYMAFAQMLLDGGEFDGAQILKPETIKLMRTNVLPDGVEMWSSGNRSGFDAKGLGFGLDFGIVSDPSLREGNYGQDSFFWGGAAGTWFWVDPVNDLYFIGMIQRFPAGGPDDVDFRSTSAQLVYDAIVE